MDKEQHIIYWYAPKFGGEGNYPYISSAKNAIIDYIKVY